MDKRSKQDKNISPAGNMTEEELVQALKITVENLNMLLSEAEARGLRFSVVDDKKEGN